MGQPAIRSMDVENGPFDPGEYRTVATYMWENVDDSEDLEESQIEANIDFVRLNADGSIREILQGCSYDGVPGEATTFDNRFCQHYDPQNTIGGSCFPNDPGPCQMRVTIPNDAETVYYGIRVWDTRDTTAPGFGTPPGLETGPFSFARSWRVDVNVDIEEPMVEEPEEPEDEPEDVEGELADDIDLTACAINPPVTSNDEWSASWTIENTGSQDARVELEWTSMGTTIEDDVVEVAAGASETGTTDLGTTQDLQSAVGVDGFDVSIRVAGAEAIELA